MKRTLLSLACLSVAFVLLAGCQRPVTTAKDKTKEAKDKKHDDHHDHGEGPHGGTIIDWGKWHVEITVEHKGTEAVLYILDVNDSKKAVPIAIEKGMLSIKSPMFQAELKARPEAGEPEGKSSRWVAKHEHFGKEQEFEGTLSGVVDGTPYSENFKEEEHDHKHKKK